MTSIKDDQLLISDSRVRRPCVVQGLLERSECDELVHQGQLAGIETTPATGDRRHRNCCTHYLEDEKLAATIYERIRKHIPQEYQISASSSSSLPSGGFFLEESIQSQDLLGRWTPRMVNSKFSMLRYQPGGHFGPHRDGYKHFDKNLRSLLTLTIYLTDRPADAGGATHFLKDDMEMPETDNKNRIRASEDSIEWKVEADEAGKAILFNHDLLHEGGALTEDGPPKWILLTQVVYQRDPESAPQLSPTEFEAREVLRQAEQAEMQGDIPSAIRLYSKAYRLDPSLDGPVA